MSGQQPSTGVLDPRLGPSPTSANPLPPSHFSDGSRSKNENLGAYPSPQPYYPYPTSQTHTPQNLPGLSSASTNSISNQASPDSYPANVDSGSPEQNDGQNQDDAKRPRACEACRGLKVRCDQDPEHPEIPCRRCAKAGRQCIITQPSRKRQKKADSRVAELEKKLDALTAVLHQSRSGPSQLTSPTAGRDAIVPPPPPARNIIPGRSSTGSVQHFQQFGNGGVVSPSHPAPNDTFLNPPQKRRYPSDESQDIPTLDGADQTNPGPLSGGTSGKDEIHGDSPRTVARSPNEFRARITSLVPPSLGATMFNRYVNVLAPHVPAVVFPPGTTAEQVWKEKPILYVCILSAASSNTLQPAISKQLASESVGTIADCVVRNGAKSLELIQAMQVLALWYRPPETADQTNFYQIIHMAAVMAIDIGLGRRFNPIKARRGFGGPNAKYLPGPHKTLPQDSDTLEARRAWLGCYYLCASASMVLRRPNLVRWTNYMKECIDVLETHPDAFASDKMLCQHIKIQHICEEIGLQFLMDDNSAQVSIQDPKVTYAINVLESQLKSWKENIPPGCHSLSLQFFEHATSLYLHEIALHLNHNVEDFRLPFTEESLKSVNNTSDTLTQQQMAALESCLNAAHGILDVMLSFDQDTVKALPILIFTVRCIYAVVILVKMHVAVTTPGSELGKMMKAEDLRVEYYIEKLIEMFRHVQKDDDYRPRPKITRILTMLIHWFTQHKETVKAQARGEQPPHSSTSQQPKNAKGQSDQTRLQLLSEVATDNQSQQSNQHQDWTVNSPFVMDYGRLPPRHHPDSRMPIHQQSSGAYPSFSENTNAYSGAFPDGGSGEQGYAIDPAMDLGWGSGFEQAMNMTLGGIEGLGDNGLDTWFLGDAMAPFAFSGDATTAEQW